MMQGQVKFFDIEKKWGFIECEDGSPDVFVHERYVAFEHRPLLEREFVMFETQTDRVTGKQKAINVRRVD